jgi:hypothetical protein
VQPSRFGFFVGGVVDGELNTRTIRTDVEFRHPFTLTGLDGVQPPGIYRVETFERLLDTVSTAAYQRVSTSIELHGPFAGIIRTATIDPDDLAAALARDTAPADDSRASPLCDTIPARATADRQPSAYEQPARRFRLGLPIGQGQISFDSRRLFWIAAVLVCGLLALLSLFPGVVERLAP